MRGKRSGTRHNSVNLEKPDVALASLQHAEDDHYDVAIMDQRPNQKLQLW